MQKIYSEYKFVFVDTKSCSKQSIFDLQLRHWAVTDSRTFSSQHLSGKYLMFLNWFVEWDLLWSYRSNMEQVLKSKAFCILRTCSMCEHCTDLRLLGSWGGASTASAWNWLCFVFLSQGFTTVLSNQGGKLHVKSVISEVAQDFCPGVFCKEIFSLYIFDWDCFDRRIADSLYFLCV